MNNLFKRLRAIEFQPRWVPVALLIATLSAYGILFWQMGFYWDDLPIAWIRYELGSPAMTRYFSDGRPAWALLYQLTTSVLPQNPVYWQAFALLWRWLDIAMLWAVLTQLLPRRQSLMFILCLLVLVYPGFNQQWVSYVYAHFFIVLFFLFASWYFMLRGKVAPALIFSALNLWMLEYFFMFEFIRPFFLWMMLRNEPLPPREKLIRVLKAWVPYLILFIIAILYRVFIFNHPGFGYSLKDELIRAPVATLSLLIQNVASSFWVATVTAWLQIFQIPDPAIAGPRTVVFYGVVVIVVGLLAYWSRLLKQDRPQAQDKSDAWWLVGLGVVMLVLGGIPFWVTNFPISLGFPANRALLSFTLGACFLLLGLIDLTPLNTKYVIVIILVALSAGRQFLWSADFRRDWQSQKNLFWQMTWRAPGMKPNTAVLMNENLSYYADNSLSAALNWIYAPHLTSEQIPYALLYPTNRLNSSLPQLNPNLSIDYYYFPSSSFYGNTSDAVAFYYDPPACLRLLDPVLDANNRFIRDESLMRDASILSNADRILRKPSAVMPKIYGPEPAHGWCYYFEQAELARQFGDWNEVAKLGNQAFKLNDAPNNAVERFVFIEGYAHVGNWPKALELSKVSYKVSKDYVGPLLCRLWNRIGAGTTVSVERSDALNKIQQMLACPAQ